MESLTKVVETFPSARIDSQSGGLAVEVSLIAQLMVGAGNHLFASVSARQKAHADFVDELDEPSAKLGGTNFDKGDPTSLYSFVVGPKGHPFHRHAGHRIFTAVSGSAGAQLRFSSASVAQIEADPHSFVRTLQLINIPADCMFTVRFGGETWHQFAARTKDSIHPVFFALSCHTNELGGDLPEDLKQKVMANEATIPSLTTLLPEHVNALLETALKETRLPTTDLALYAPPGSFMQSMCMATRSNAGRLTGALGKWRGSRGYITRQARRTNVIELPQAPAGSLLLNEFANEHFHHEDTFSLTMDLSSFDVHTPTGLMSAVLEGFLTNPPASVARMMAFRNTLVRPMGLRTSPLGCPVSSLLSPDRSNLFANRFPVLAQSVDETRGRAQVVLGANDKHLVFRSCVGVQLLPHGRVQFTLGTRVRCKNLFGRFYMAVIDHVHRSYVTPTMLSRAVDEATSKAQQHALAGAAAT